MVRLLSILVLSGFLLQVFGKVLILANYEINKAYIAANLCENKDEPEMECHGRCHLKKQIEADDKKQGGPISTVKEQQEVQLFQEYNDTPTMPSYYGTLYTFRPYLAENPSTVSFSIFHPPSV